MKFGLTSSSCDTNLEYAQHSPDCIHLTWQCHECSCVSGSHGLIETTVGRKQLGIQLVLPIGSHPCTTNSTKYVGLGCSAQASDFSGFKHIKPHLQG